MLTIRKARFSDVPAIEQLIARETELGTLRPRFVLPAAFLVADGPGGTIAGIVAVDRLTSKVCELGSLVAAEPGHGVGSLLVQSALLWAEERGFESIVALTGAQGFFDRFGFRASADTPWARALKASGRPAPTPLTTSPRLAAAATVRARTCLSCERLGACGQSFLVRSIEAFATAEVYA